MVRGPSGPEMAANHWAMDQLYTWLIVTRVLDADDTSLLCRAEAHPRFMYT